MVRLLDSSLTFSFLPTESVINAVSFSLSSFAVAGLSSKMIADES